MKPVFALILASFIGIAVFGFIALDHGSIFSQCVASVLPGGSMPCETSLDSNGWHANAYLGFSIGILASTISALILFTVLAFRGYDISQQATRTELCSAVASPGPTDQQQKTYRWYRLTQRRDPLVY